MQLADRPFTYHWVLLRSCQHIHSRAYASRDSYVSTGTDMLGAGLNVLFHGPQKGGVNPGCRGSTEAKALGREVVRAAGEWLLQESVAEMAG